MEELSPRGVLECRGCGRGTLVSVLDLGRQPLSNEMARTTATPDPTFPLHLKICSGCGLGQVGEYVLPSRIFGEDYPYLSSVSTTWVAHARSFAALAQDRLGLAEGDLVMEIASNDGYLLEQFKAMQVRVLGVEPAGRVANLARAKGVPTIHEFFDLGVARRIVAEHGHPRLVVANNVMAHVPDLLGFAEGLAALCAASTIVTVENPSLLHLLREAQFDTIYHEHFSYLSAHAMVHIADQVGLRLVRVDSLTTHGGSNRYWLTRDADLPPDESVASVLHQEASGGLLDSSLWQDFASRSLAAVDGLRVWLARQKDLGLTVAGYGAAAKGNTLFNAAGVTRGEVLLVADESPAKQGRYLPGSQISVTPPNELSACAPDSVLILPWNIAEEVVPIIAELAPNAACWIAVPAMRQLTR